MKKTLPQLGNSPKVMPRAVENANCFGLAPVRENKKRGKIYSKWLQINFLMLNNSNK